MRHFHTYRFSVCNCAVTGYMALLAILPRPLLTTSGLQTEISSPIEGGESVLERRIRVEQNAAVIEHSHLLLMARSRDFVLFFASPTQQEISSRWLLPVRYCSYTVLALYDTMIRIDIRALPRRTEVVAAVGCALHISKQLITVTEVGKTTRMEYPIDPHRGALVLSGIEKATLDEAAEFRRLE